MRGDLYITGDPEGDELLNTDPLALLLGMLLDQHMPTRRPGTHHRFAHRRAGARVRSCSRDGWRS